MTGFIEYRLLPDGIMSIWEIHVHGVIEFSWQLRLEDWRNLFLSRMSKMIQKEHLAVDGFSKNLIPTLVAAT